MCFAENEIVIWVRALALLVNTFSSKSISSEWCIPFIDKHQKRSRLNNLIQFPATSSHWRCSSIVMLRFPSKRNSFSLFFRWEQNEKIEKNDKAKTKSVTLRFNCSRFIGFLWWILYSSSGLNSKCTSAWQMIVRGAECQCGQFAN